MPDQELPDQELPVQELHKPEVLPSIEQLCGLDSGHVARSMLRAGHSITVHPAIVAPLRKLSEAAQRDGFDLRVASGFRDYGRQLTIWNRKANGELPVLSVEEEKIDVSTLGAGELLFAMLYWSALPGCSRHHWGTDIDIYDAAAVEPDYNVELTQCECDRGGPFGPFHRWLDERLDTGNAFGFFRPYTIARSGVAPEPWHLSWAPLSRRCQAILSAERLCQAAKHGTPALGAEIDRHFDRIYTDYIDVPIERYPLAYRDLPNREMPG